MAMAAHDTRSTMPGGRRLVALLVAVVAAAMLLDAGYVHAKALLAQHLLARAWALSLCTGAAVKPWPWADVTPVAQLSVPRLGIEQIVLAGDSGRALAFAPGWSASSAHPAGAGVSVISAHRDTHFRFLEHVVVGDIVVLRSMTASRRYRIETLAIADVRHERIAMNDDGELLVLVTCFPFDALEARGPLRFVAQARAQPEAERSPDADREKRGKRSQASGLPQPTAGMRPSPGEDVLVVEARGARRAATVCPGPFPAMNLGRNGACVLHESWNY